MKNTIRECVNALGKENDKEATERYVEECMGLQGRYSRVRLMMEYYMCFETISQSSRYATEEVKGILEEFHHLVQGVFAEDKQDKDSDKMGEAILKLRQQVVDKMQVLTAYVDCFSVYEYVLNRIQYRYEDMEMQPEDTVFARELMQFIFGSGDNVAINEGIRYAVSQLPMRMSRSRYFDVIKDTMSLYKGAEESSMESFLYMFRTCAMMYQNEHMDKYFTEFKPVLEEMSTWDYENMSMEAYEIFKEKIAHNTACLQELADIHLSVGQLLNDLYGVCVTKKYLKEGDIIPETVQVVQGILELFQESYTSFWDGMDAELTDSEEDKLEWLAMKFQAVEGEQENLLECLNVGEGALELLENMEEDMEAELSDKVKLLQNLYLLTSDSTFAELDKKECTDIVTEERVEEEAGRLIAECKEFLQGKSKLVRRGIMSNTLLQMPVMFQSAQEVSEYIMDSLNRCNDEAEKYAGKEILMDLMK